MAMRHCLQRDQANSSPKRVLERRSGGRRFQEPESTPACAEQLKRRVLLLPQQSVMNRSAAASGLHSTLQLEGKRSLDLAARVGVCAGQLEVALDHTAGVLYGAKRSRGARRKPERWRSGLTAAHSFLPYTLGWGRYPQWPSLLPVGGGATRVISLS